MKELGGFSVIPLNGKKPHPQITTWKQWQKERPSIEQLSEWFGTKGVEAYGIITGKVSNGLFVIDFDNMESYRKFKNDLPKIGQTYTVKTRRGRHVYLRLSTKIKSMQFNGGDFQGDGRYVVGPGSRVGEHTYKVINEQEICHLNRYETQQLKKWLTKESQEVEECSVTESNNTLKTLNIKEIYKTTASKIGRNNALYKTAQIAKHRKVEKTHAINQLVNLHINTRKNTRHISDTKKARELEAIRTINSAYNSTNAIKLHKEENVKNYGLIPNEVREGMLKHYGSSTQGRLLEACMMEGWQGHQYFTMSDIQGVARKYKIGDQQVRIAVKGKYNQSPKKEKIYKEVVNVPIVKNKPHVWDMDNITKKAIQQKNEVNDIIDFPQHVPNHIVSSGGRRPQLYIFPDIDYLCDLFDVVSFSSDYLTTRDLLSSKHYLMALHRELILRLAPEYPTAWHAKRLGVSERTIRRYNKEIGVIITPIFEYRNLNWDNIDDIELWKSSIRINVNGQDITPGHWIQRSDGKRYPAIKGVALDWMGQSKDKFVMCYRRPSRLQLAHTNQHIIIKNVIWRCLDRSNQPEWSGNEHDFPPIYRPNSVLRTKKTLSITKPFTHSIPPKKTDNVNFIPVNIEPDKQGLLDNIPLEGEQARQTLGLIRYEKINLSLSLIRGLGTSRITQLHDQGIFTLEQLIILGSEHLYASISWRGREYLSPASCEKWVQQARYLLNWENPEPKVIAEEKHQQKQREATHHYKKNVQRFIDYLIEVCEWEDEIFQTGNIDKLSWNSLLKWFMNVVQDTESDPIYLTDPRIVDNIHTKICEFCTFYQARIDLFLRQEQSELDKYVFGSMKKWKSLKRSTAHQFARFESNDVWIGWN